VRLESSSSAIRAFLGEVERIGDVGEVDDVRPNCGPCTECGDGSSASDQVRFDISTILAEQCCTEAASKFLS
jgi:hypothetical protein